MKNLVKSILIISTPLWISGCLWFSEPHIEQPVEIIYINKYIECPKMEKPLLVKFDGEYHIGHLKNMEILRENMELSLKYTDSLENTIQCYVDQATN